MTSLTSLTKQPPMFSSSSADNDDFKNQWPYASIVARELGAKRWDADLEKPKRTYKSGRNVLAVSFFDRENKLIETREGMALMSKKTSKEFVVCLSTAALAERAELPLRGGGKGENPPKNGRSPATGQFDLSDVLP